ncbi:MAG: putative mutator mutT1 protein [Actinomycetia bacterium]|nr:putative mutator mutT1 protein [Actinomycetes bacterium]
MLVRVVRHACAGSRDEWEGDDLDRPLDPVGRLQAEALAEQFGREPAGRLLSSPARRCVETLAPLAARWELPIVVDEALATDAGADRFLELVTDQAFDRDLLCTHGEVMEAALGRLDPAVVRADRADLLGKGTVWELTVIDGAITALRHVVPSGLRRCEHHADGFVRT